MLHNCRRAAPALVSISVLLACATTAAAQANDRWYIPRAHRACRTHYRRTVVHVDKTRRVRHHGHLVTIKVRRHGHVVKVRQVRCVRRAVKKTTTAAPAATIHYGTSVDPTFTQSPTNPLAVTYSYSADATETVAGDTVNLAATGELPAGIVNFYSSTTNGGPEQLYCSVNVGASTSSGACPITYPGVGTYQVTTQYIPSGSTAVTETDSETITPFPSTASVSVSYGTQNTETGPPPLNLVTEYVGDAIQVTSSDPDNTGLTATLTDETSGERETGTPVPGDGCALLFLRDAQQTSTFGMSPSCGLPAMTFSGGDQLTVSVTATGSDGWLPATSPTVSLTAPW